MTPEDKKYFEEFLFKAVQSGKKETSDLVADILTKMKPMIAVEIADGIETNVNGKIRKLTTIVEGHNTMVDVYIKEDKADNERMKEETIKWRKDADDKLQLVGNVQGFGKVALYFGGFVITIGGAVALLLKWLHNN